MRVRQLALPFAHVPHLTASDFLAAPSNADALEWISRTAEWPAGRLALFGAASVGKTHLLHIWAASRAACLLDGASLTLLDAIAPPAGPLAIDDADAAPPRALLHVLNTAAEAAQPLLLAARAPPAHWAAQSLQAGGPAYPADLSSRLRAITAVPIEAPEETLLRALLARLLAERQLAVPETVQDWLLLRLPRSAAAIHEAAGKFDHVSLIIGGRAPRIVAARVLAEMTGDETTQGGTPEWQPHEDFGNPARAASPDGPRLL